MNEREGGSVMCSAPPLNRRDDASRFVGPSIPANTHISVWSAPTLARTFARRMFSNSLLITGVLM